MTPPPPRARPSAPFSHQRACRSPEPVAAELERGCAVRQCVATRKRAPRPSALLTRAWLGAEAHGQRTTALLGKAYTTISPDAATGLTGLADVRTELVSGAGWTEEQGMLVAPSAGSGASQPAQGQGTAGMQQLQQLTEYIVRLDT